MFQLGLDFGSTLTKMAMTKPGALDYPAPQAIFQYKTRNDPSLFYKALEEFLKAENILLSDIDSITATGTHANVVKDNILNIPTRIVGEVESIGRGALALTGLDQALVVNMGTGTTYVLADKEGCRHIGGTGVGGGTLSGLGSYMLKCKSVKDIISLSAQGDLEKVDLLIKDVTDQTLLNLPPYLTAANFGKMGHSLYEKEAAQAGRADVARGLINLILQVIGSMAVMVCKSCNTTNVIFVGSLTRLPQITETYSMFSKVYDLHFIVPPFAVFATALGSTLTSPVV